MTIREQLLAIKLKRKAIILPDGIGEAFVVELTGEQRAELELLSVETKDARAAYKKLSAMTVCFCLVNKEGEQIFSTDDVDAVAKLPARVIDKIMDASGSLARLSEDAIKKQQSE